MAIVKINIDPKGIIAKRKLQKDGSAQRFFTSEVRRLSDPYVPFDNGPLKNTAIESTDKITYIQPYAERQFYGNKGYGNGGTSRGGLRGKLWSNRMWADRGKEILSSIAKFVGGKVK